MSATLVLQVQVEVERARVNDVPVVGPQEKVIGRERTGSRPRVEKVVQLEVIQRKRDGFGIEGVLVAARHVIKRRVAIRRLRTTRRGRVSIRLENVPSGLDPRKQSLEVAEVSS